MPYHKVSITTAKAYERLTSCRVWILYYIGEVLREGDGGIRGRWRRRLGWRGGVDVVCVEVI